MPLPSASARAIIEHMNHGIAKSEAGNAPTGRASPSSTGAAPRGFPEVSLPPLAFDASRDLDLEGLAFGVGSMVVIVTFLTSFVLLEGGERPLLGTCLGAASVALLFLMGRWAFHRL
jgi:hypothetical protein